jgi:macrodomain Ter protein organizer (MatP/YcbG family)
VSNYKVLLLIKVKNLIKTRVRRLLFFNLNKKRIKKKIFNIEKIWQQFSPRRGVWGLN